MIKGKTITILALLVALLILNPAKPALSHSNSDVANQTYADKWALVIGVNSFKYQIKALDYAEKDATDFRNYLVNEANFQTDHVLLLDGKNATYANINKGLDWLKRASSKHDLVVVYLRTHGIYASYVRTSYFAASDTAEDFDLTAFRMDAFPPLVAKSLNAADLVMILDSDYSGAAVDIPSRAFDQIRKQGYKRGLHIYASTNESEPSTEGNGNSKFTGSFLSALRNSGDKPLSKLVPSGNSERSAGDVKLSAPVTQARSAPECRLVKP